MCSKVYYKLESICISVKHCRRFLVLLLVIYDISLMSDRNNFTNIFDLQYLLNQDSRFCCWIFLIKMIENLMYLFQGQYLKVANN